MKNTCVAAIAIFVISFVVVGCHSESPISGTTAAGPTTTGLTSQTQSAIKPSIVDSLLGQVVTLVLPSKGATLEIRSTRLTIKPAALRIPTLVTFSLWNARPPRGLRDAPNRVFSFFPDGLVFGTPSTLTVPFSELGVTRQTATGIACFYYNELTLKYERQPTTVDYVNEVFIVQLGHFSQYAFGRLNKE